MIEKPDALILYEQIQAVRIPYSDGGIEDQPYILLMELGICDQEQRRFDSLEAASDRQEQEDRLAKLFAKK